MPLFAVTLERFGDYDLSRDLREQRGWEEHAAFMDGLVDDGFVVLGGPLEDGVHTLQAVRATDADEVRRRFAQDPWHGTHLRIASISEWEILLRGALT